MVDFRCWYCKKMIGQLLIYSAEVVPSDIRYYGVDENGHLLCDDCLDKKEKEGAKVIEVK